MHPAITLAQSGTGDTSVEVSPAQQATEAIENMAAGLFSALPRLGIALVVLAVFVVVAKLLRRPIERRLASLRTPSFGRVFGTMAYALILVIGVVIAIPIAAPSVNVLTMLSGLGLLGVAAGFAFQDILSNLLAGVLLLLRQPFTSGDQIEVNGVAGTVQLITIRETRIRTFDGRLVYVPNADVYSNAIEVQTAEDTVRTSLVVGVDYDADLALARSTALEVLRDIDGIASDPEPQGYYTQFAASSIDLDLRYWTDSHQAEIRRVQDQVVERIKAAFDEAGIGIPFGIVTLDASESFERAMVHALGGEREGASSGSSNGRTS